MNMEFYRKLPTPKELKEEFPASDKIQKIKAERDAEIRAIFEGKNDKLLLVIGPCSADREDAVLEYIGRLVKVQEKVKDKIFIIPRIYTNKPRTVGCLLYTSRKLTCRIHTTKINRLSKCWHPQNDLFVCLICQLSKITLSAVVENVVHRISEHLSLIHI